MVSSVDHGVDSPDSSVSVSRARCALPFRVSPSTESSRTRSTRSQLTVGETSMGPLILPPIAAPTRTVSVEQPVVRVGAALFLLAALARSRLRGEQRLRRGRQHPQAGSRQQCDRSGESGCLLCAVRWMVENGRERDGGGAGIGPASPPLLVPEGSSVSAVQRECYGRG